MSDQEDQNKGQEQEVDNLLGVSAQELNAQSVARLEKWLDDNKSKLRPQAKGHWSQNIPTSFRWAQLWKQSATAWRRTSFVWRQLLAREQTTSVKLRTQLIKHGIDPEC